MKTNRIFNFINHIKFAAIISAIALISFSSCTKDLLDLKPQTSITAENAFTTSSQILAQVNGLYADAKTSGFYGGGLVSFTELHADEFINSSQNTGDGAAIFNNSVSPSYSQIVSTWSGGYTLINNANILIDNLGKSTVLLSTTQTKSDSIKNIYIGEAKFLRALAYLDLVQFYAQPYATAGGAQSGLPLRLTAITSLQNGDLARSSVSQIYSQILSDLNDAETVLPVTNTSTALNSYRAHKASAIALKTRVYLSKGDYANVVTEAAKIINPASPETGIGAGSVHKLDASITTVFSGSYTGAEAILFFPFNTSDAGTSQAHPDYFFLNTGFVTLNPNNIAKADSLTIFSATSGDARNNFITRVLTGGKQTSITFKKFPTKSPLIDYVPAIRYAEILLNYAEALARTGDESNAIQILKAVRKRSNATYTFPAADLLSTNLINTILHERRVELLGEGLRLFDLYRLGLPIPAKTANIAAVPISSNQYIWPIPSTETATNSLIN